MKLRYWVALILCFKLIFLAVAHTGDSNHSNPLPDKKTQQKALKRYKQVVISRSYDNTDTGNFMDFHGKYLIFTSDSLGILGLEDIYSKCDGISDYVVVYNGLPVDEDEKTAIAKMRQSSKKYRNGVNVIVSPALFAKYNVTVVPTIIKLDESLGVEAFIKGTTDLNSFTREIEKSPLQTNFGVKGDVVEILEPALIEEIKVDKKHK